MSRTSRSNLLEIQVLTKSVEVVLRELLRFLVGKMSLVRLQEMVRLIYVQEAEDKLRKESPENQVSLTELGLLTGLDTRTLTKTRTIEGYRKPFHRKTTFLRESTPAAALIDTWVSSAKFTDSASGKPKTLPISGHSGSFEALFSASVKSRGITMNSLLDRLVESGSVERDPKTNTVELVKPYYLATRSRDQLGQFEMGYAAAANLIQTIVHNFESGDESGEKFFQRGVWTHKLPLAKQSRTRKELRGILGDAESKSRKLLREQEASRKAKSQMTVGVSLFYFEQMGEEG